ncbi:MAG: ATP-binding protein [Gammaproteobacteria bacterium]|nr:ATP-binding protein [Gammaproteobacteria bacterium]
MLIEARVENFRSFSMEQQFSLTKGAGKELPENSFAPELASGAKSLPLLRCAAIYGSNAAGKSNWLKAIAAMQRIVMTSASGQPGDPLPVTPFLFDEEQLQKPTTFEVTVIVEGVRYQYGFSCTTESIIDEWLFAYPKGRPQRWFEREQGQFEFGDYFKGERELWRTATRSNALFLSTAVQLNSEQLQPLFGWFSNTLRIAGVNGWLPDNTARKCQSEMKQEVIDFLQAADFSIHDIIVKKRNFETGALPKELPPPLRAYLEYQLKDSEGMELYTRHKTRQGGSVQLPFSDESDGTQKMFSFAGPWLDTLKHGRVLILDELHDNLHPALVMYLVGLFHSKKSNPHNAQLIFTTHETSILSQEIFRRDQIWFCERDENQSSQLYPLTDFSPRKGAENLERGYLMGRYGAIPYVQPDLVTGMFDG